MQNESQQGDQIWLFTNTVKTQFKYWPVFARNLAIFARNLSNLATILDETLISISVTLAGNWSFNGFIVFGYFAENVSILA